MIGAIVGFWAGPAAAATAPGPTLDWNGADLLTQFKLLYPSPESIPLPKPRPLNLPLRIAETDRPPTPLECLPEVIDAFKTIWKLAGYGMRPYEAAFRIDQAGDGYQIVFMPLTYSYHQTKITVIPGVTVAIAHTHPANTSYLPSWKDLEAAYPNYVVSRRSLYVTEPGK
ncbi:MAG: hypothetical protein WC881_04325, partial [Elusimicrobiota bacterium]